MTAITPETPVGRPEKQTEERSLFQQSMRRLLRNKVAVVSGIFIIILTLMAIFAPVVTPHERDKQDLLATSAVPEWMLFILPENADLYATISDKFPLGADDLGRDLYTRVIYGARVSLMVAYVAGAISLVIGIVYGLIAGYNGGMVDTFMMLVIDFLIAFPALVLLILFSVFVKNQSVSGEGGGVMQGLIALNNQMGGVLLVFIAIGLLSWLALARITRAQVLAMKQKEFVEAAVAMGAPSTRVIFKHILPNILGPIVVAESLALPGYIFTEAFLSFIGLGVNAPTPSWGIMISEGLQSIRSYPNQVLVPAVFLSLTTLAFNFLGDGLRDAFDPKQVK